MWRTTRAALLAALALALLAPAGAAAAPKLIPVGDFISPVSVAAPPRDRTRLFVVERAGTIQLIHDGSRTATPFLDITSEVDSDPSTERGLLSMAFAPDYETSGLFYVYMVAAGTDGEIQIREYRRSAADPDVADPTTGRVVFAASHSEAGNHNGGQVQWGPDGFLWFATGDGGGGNDVFGHARDLASPLGKMLRIDPRPSGASQYTIPGNNPYSSAVWADGLRNPFRFSFDRQTGDLLIGDVGQGAREEIDWATAASGLGRAADYGWSCREGSIAGPNDCELGANYIPPIFDYDSTAGAHAVTGGYVVRDPGLPTLRGRYLYADFYDGDIRSLRLARGATDDRSTGLSRGFLVSFGEDACGRIYVVSLGGTVDRIQDGAPGACVFKPGPPALPPQVPPAAGGGGRPGTPDRTSPRISIRAARHGRVGRRATPRIQVTVSEDCRVTISAKLAGTKLKRVRTPLRGGRRTIVRLRPKANAIKRIHRALRRHRRVTMLVAIVAVDPSGNVGRLTRRVTVRKGG